MTRGLLVLSVALGCWPLQAAGTIDPDPVPAARSMVINRQDLTVAGEPRCGMDVRYRGKIDQPVTFIGARCAALKIEWVTLATLGRGRAAALSPETRRDVARAPGGKTLLITGRTRSGQSAQLFPINVADQVYRVPLPR